MKNLRPTKRSTGRGYAAPVTFGVMFQIIQGNRFTRVIGRDRHILMHFIKKMAESVERYAYRQSEIARHLRLHVSTASTMLRVRG